MRKIIDNGYIVGLSNDAEEMTAEEVTAIENAQRNIPPYQDGFIRKLRADTLTWELFPAPTVEDEHIRCYTEDELLAMTNANMVKLIIALQGAGSDG